jgi:hypothetical protein
MHYTKTDSKMQGKNPLSSKKSKIPDKRPFKAENGLFCSHRTRAGAILQEFLTANFKNLFFD